jgi:hypothetical protein
MCREKQDSANIGIAFHGALTNMSQFGKAAGHSRGGAFRGQVVMQPISSSMNETAMPMLPAGGRIGPCEEQ